MLLFASIGCKEQEPAPATRPKVQTTLGSASASASASVAPSASAPTAAVPASCPEGMRLMPGGDFWVGSDPKEHFSDDESPRYRTRLASFCIDETEVTAEAYDACVAKGACVAASQEKFLCTSGRKGTQKHPINCVSFAHAAAFCKAHGQRLPSEAEFEYVARGGDRYLKYPWGSESPDGRACWKHNGTCEVKSYAAGAFGLYDISGNVWEWTADYYGPYPWPPEQAFARVYRGGSFSRRFEKWMHTRLRNRSMPYEWGSHLGFRCASEAAGASCPYGAHPDGSCRHGVEQVECSPGKVWNGVRCAAPDQPRCATGRSEKAGFGCVPQEAPSSGGRDIEAEVANVKRQRTPEFDADCRTNLRDRPQAWRYVGGTHSARNTVGKRHGCKNRDVGVGWNSACCP